MVIGPSARWGTQAPFPGLTLDTGPGDDSIQAVNGAGDSIDCGDGADTLLGDPWDTRPAANGLAAADP